MADKFFYICDAKRKIADGACSGAACKYLKKGECERTSDEKYAKNKFDRDQGDIDIYSEKNKKGEYI